MRRKKKFSIKLDKAQRKFASKHLMNGGYGALAALVFSQITTQQISIVLLAIGFVIYGVAWFGSIRLMRGTE